MRQERQKNIERGASPGIKTPTAEEHGEELYPKPLNPRALPQWSSTENLKTWTKKALAKTPPMGWRSWNAFRRKVSQANMIQTVAEFDRKNLKQLGYVDVGLDDAFQQCNTHPCNDECNKGKQQCRFHDGEGKLLWRKDTFPDPGKMVQKATAVGLTMGFYANNCMCKELVQDEAERKKQIAGDVRAMKQLGFSQVKLDGCGTKTDLSEWVAEYKRQKWEGVVENCHWGGASRDKRGVPGRSPNIGDIPAHFATGPQNCDHYHFARTSGDIAARFRSMVWNLNSVSAPPYVGPDCWAYPDMLEVANWGTKGDGQDNDAPEWNPPEDEKITEAWDKLHFAGWAVNSVPLVLGMDLTDEERWAKARPIVTNRAAIAVNQAWNGDVGRRLYSWEPNTMSSGVGTLFVWLRECGTTLPAALEKRFYNDGDRGLKWRFHEKDYEAATGRKLPQMLQKKAKKQNEDKVVSYCLHPVKDTPTALVKAEVCGEGEQSGVYLEGNAVKFRDGGNNCATQHRMNQMERRAGYGLADRKKQFWHNDACAPNVHWENEGEGILVADSHEPVGPRKLCFSMQASAAFYFNTLQLYGKQLPDVGTAKAAGGMNVEEALARLFTQDHQINRPNAGGVLWTERSAVFVLNVNRVAGFEVHLTPCMLAEIFQKPVLDIDRRARQMEDLLPPILLSEDEEGEGSSTPPAASKMSDEVVYVSSGEMCADVCGAEGLNKDCRACEPRHSYFGTGEINQDGGSASTPKAKCCKGDECGSGIRGGSEQALCMVPYPKNRLPFAGIGRRGVCSKDTQDQLTTKYEYAIADVWGVEGDRGLLTADAGADFKVTLPPTASGFYVVLRRTREREVGGHAGSHGGLGGGGHSGIAGDLLGENGEPSACCGASTADGGSALEPHRLVPPGPHPGGGSPPPEQRKGGPGGDGNENALATGWAASGSGRKRRWSQKRMNALATGWAASGSGRKRRWNPKRFPNCSKGLHLLLQPSRQPDAANKNSLPKRGKGALEKLATARRTGLPWTVEEADVFPAAAVADLDEARRLRASASSFSLRENELPPQAKCVEVKTGNAVLDKNLLFVWTGLGPNSANSVQFRFYAHRARKHLLVLEISTDSPEAFDLPLHQAPPAVSATDRGAADADGGTARAQSPTADLGTFFPKIPAPDSNIKYRLSKTREKESEDLQKALLKVAEAHSDGTVDRSDRRFSKLPDTVFSLSKDNPQVFLVAFASNTNEGLLLSDAELVDIAKTRLQEAMGLSPATLYQEHAAAWAKLWEGGVEIHDEALLGESGEREKGGEKVAKSGEKNRDKEVDAVREGVSPDISPTLVEKTTMFSLYYLLSSFREDVSWSSSPGGLATNGYNGHVFWDTELWMLPGMLLFHPEIVKTGMLQYRVKTIQGARRRSFSDAKKGSACDPPGEAYQQLPDWLRKSTDAGNVAHANLVEALNPKRKNGSSYTPPRRCRTKGARFAWESALTGMEAGPDGWFTVTNEIHNTAGVAFAADMYMKANRGTEAAKQFLYKRNTGGGEPVTGGESAATGYEALLQDTADFLSGERG
eukprot:g18976.t1